MKDAPRQWTDPEVVAAPWFDGSGARWSPSLDIRRLNRVFETARWQRDLEHLCERARIPSCVEIIHLVWQRDPSLFRDRWIGVSRAAAEAMDLLPTH